MFELTKIYTCNGCATVSTESKAKKWTHVNNNPDDGKLSMDFCPDCYDKIRVLFTVPTDTPTAKSTKKRTVVTDSSEETKPSVTDEIISEHVDNTVPTQSTADSTAAELFIDFYTQLYTRAMFAIACDNNFTEVTEYVKYLPGFIKVESNSKTTGTQLTLNWNDKRVHFKRESEGTASTEIKVCKGTSTMIVRKVSKFGAVQTLINDTSKSSASLMPTQAEHYSIDYIQDRLEDIDCAIDEGAELHELKEWINYALMHAGIEPT